MNNKKLTLQKLNSLLYRTFFTIKNENEYIYLMCFNNRIDIIQKHYFNDNAGVYKSYELRVLNNKIFVIENGKVLYCFNHYKKVIRYIKKIFKNFKKSEIKYKW